MKLFRLLLTTLLSLLISLVYAQDETFAGSGTCGGAANSGAWTVPAGVTSITVEVCGAGGGAGGGGGGSNGGLFNTRGGGGGGAGAFSSITINVTPGSTFSYSSGSGGCGGNGGGDAQSGDNGSGGGTSTFSGTDANGNPVNLQLVGGGGGTGGSGTNGSAGSGGSAGTASGGCDNAGASGSNGSGEIGGVGATAVGPCGGAGGASDGGNASNYGGGGGGGEDSDGGDGAPGVINITFNPSSGALPTPTISTTPATTTSDGVATIDNYDPSYTYTFSPTGPTVGAGGVILGMIPGTNYTVVASDGGCNSLSSNPFSVDPQITGPNAPIISTTAATCASNGGATIDNYDHSYTYTFSPAGPTVGGGGVISGLTPSTSYTVIATDANNNDSPASNAFSVDPSTSGVTVVFNVAPSTFCVDASPITLSATPTGGTFSGPGVSGNTFTPSQASVGTNTLTYTYDDGNGCITDETADVEVFDLPVLGFTGLGTDYCVNETTPVTLSGVPAGGTYSGSGITGTDFIPSDAGVGTHTITYEYTDGNGCTNTSDNTVEVNALPNVSAGNDAFVCNGASVTLNATGASSYVWSPATGLSDPNIANPKVNITSEETYTVTGTDANGCVNIDDITVGVGSNPTADFEVETACAETPIVFTNTSLPTGLNYSWNFGNGNTSSTENPAEAFSSGGDYAVQLIVDNGSCTDTSIQTLTVLDQPIAEFTALPLLAIANEDVVAFDNTSSNGNAFVWDFGDGSAFDDSFEPTHVYTEPGLYSPILIASSDDGCTDTLSLEEYIEVIERSNFFVPNAFSPNGDGLNDVFEVFGQGIKEYYITIHDRWGELLFASDDHTETWDGTKNGTSLPPNVFVYYIKVSFDDLSFETYQGSIQLLK